MIKIYLIEFLYCLHTVLNHLISYYVDCFEYDWFYHYAQYETVTETWYISVFLFIPGMNGILISYRITMLFAVMLIRKSLFNDLEVYNYIYYLCSTIYTY